MTPEMRPGVMTDGEINAELKAATGERREALQAQLDERRAYRAAIGGFGPVDVIPIGYRGAGKGL
jgi:hypothetical protein